MPSDGVEIRVTGAEQLRDLARDLKAAGEVGKGLRRDLLAAMRAAEKPMVDAARAEAKGTLPKAGGLNEWVANSYIKAQNRLTGSGVGVRIVARKGKHDLFDMDESGSIRHPVYGNRKNWVGQRVPSGWFTKAMVENSPMVTAALVAAMEWTARRIENTPTFGGGFGGSTTTASIGAGAIAAAARRTQANSKGTP